MELKMELKPEVISTGVNVEKRKFTWRINNFNLVRRSDQFVNAQHFQFKAGESIDLKTEWKLYLTVNNRKQTKDAPEKIPWIGIHLWCTKRPDNVEEVNAVHQFSIVSIEKKSAKIFGGLHLEYMKNYVKSPWGFSCVIEKDAKSQDIPLIDGCLVVEMEFHLYAPTPPPPMITAILNEVESIIAKFKPKFTERLQSDLGKLLTGRYVYSEGRIKIISKDGVKFEVNKCIFSARSPVFEKMLEADNKKDEAKANTGDIRFDELSSKPVAALLRFTETGTLHEEWSHPEVIIQLVYAAGKYQLPDLVQFLDNVLGNICSKETCGELLNLASKLGMKKAEKEIFEWIKMNISSSNEMVALIRQGSQSGNP